MSEQPTSKLVEIIRLAEEAHLTDEQKAKVNDLFFKSLDDFKERNIPGQGFASIVGYMISGDELAAKVCRKYIQEIVDERPAIWPVTLYKK